MARQVQPKSIVSLANPGQSRIAKAAGTNTSNQFNDGFNKIDIWRIINETVRAVKRRPVFSRRGWRVLPVEYRHRVCAHKLG